jgi:hypothetical protein
MISGSPLWPPQPPWDVAPLLYLFERFPYAETTEDYKKSLPQYPGKVNWRNDINYHKITLLDVPGLTVPLLLSDYFR